MLRFCCGCHIDDVEEETEPPDTYQFEIDLEKQINMNKTLNEMLNKNSKYNYHAIEYLNEGHFSKVYKSYDKINDNIVAIKRVSLKYKKSFIKETEILLKLKTSKNIIKLLDIFRDEKYVYIVLPYYEEDLFNYLPKVLGKPNKIFKILLGIAEGLFNIHSQNIMHGDIKLENILINKNEIPILIDFGLSKVTSKKIELEKLSKRISGTYYYLAPEILTNYIYTKKFDIWGCGIIMYIMLFNRYPFQDKKYINIFNKIINKKPKYPF